MPLYEYRCDSCGHTFEIIQRFSDQPVQVCPSCGQGPVQKLLSAPAIQFKGSGWYVTDYARKGSESSAAGKNGRNGKDGAGGEKPAEKAADKPAGQAGETGSDKTETKSTSPSS